MATEEEIMIRLGLKELDWELIGASLAQCDDDVQALFFQSFVKECKSWGTNFQVEGQLAAVNSHLTKEEREILSMIGFSDEG
jgi:hypothetical protein